ncbi:uncharacterized protein [Spinacia oleracea]|uniref:PWWP domain-containing protein n=1 Tax=Spinacia oleracea TaxID=3562 RepID=A0A9R0IRJ5_SPIOL|nr:uncharacterized protein LOC110792455 [Spinacia oleracea]
MDAKVVHIIETEVSDFSVRDNSRDRDYENNVGCEQPLLAVKSVVEAVDQGLASEPAAEGMKHKSRDDVPEADTNIESVPEVEEHAAKTEVVELHAQKDVDQELIPEMMDEKAVAIVEKEVPDVSIRGSSGAHLNSGPRQIEDREYGDHVEQLSLPVKSCVHGQEYEPSYLVVKDLEHRTTVDLPEIDTEMEDAKEVLERAVDSAAVELPREQEVNEDLVSVRIDTEVVPTVEKEVFDVSSGSSLNLDSGSTQAGVREYGDHAINKQPPLPVKSLDKVIDQVPEYEPSLSVSEHSERRTTDDFHEVDSEIEDVKRLQEQAADTEAFELPKEQEVDNKLVSEKMDAKVVHIVEEVPDVSLEGSLHLGSYPSQVGDREDVTHLTNEQPPFPVNTIDEGVDHGLEYVPESSVAENLEHRATGDFHEVDSAMEDVREMEEQAVNSDLPKEQVVYQELESEKTDAEVVPIVETGVPNVSIRGSLDLDSDPRQAEDRSNEDHTAYEQPPFPINLIDKGLDHGEEYEPGSSVARHLEHRTTGDIHEVDTYIEDVKKVQEQAAIMEVAKSPKEQDVDQKLVHEKVVAKAPIVETEVPNVSNGGSSVEDVDSGLRQVGDIDYKDNGSREQPSLRVKSFYNGEHHVPGSPVAERLEHGVIDDIHEFDRDVENGKEIPEQVASTEAVELPDEQEVDQEMVCKKMDAKIASIKEIEVPIGSIGGSPSTNLNSSSRQIREGEIGDRAAYEHQSLPIKSSVEGVDNGLEYEAASIVDEKPEHGAVGEFHEVDTNMNDVQEAPKQAANNTQAIDLPKELVVDQGLVSVQMETNVVLVVEAEVPDVCTRSCPGVDMDLGPIHSGDREYGDAAACEQPLLLAMPLVNRVHQGLEYEPGSSVTERLEHSATDDVEGVNNGLEYEAGSTVDKNPEYEAIGEVHEVDTIMDDVQEVQEQAANNTEAIELTEEQGVDQDPVSGEMETIVVLVEDTEVPDVCSGGSPGVGMNSSPIYIGDESGDDAACVQPPLVVKEYEPGSLVTERLEDIATDDVEGVDNKLEYEALSIVDENPEYEAIGEVHEVDTNIDNVQEGQEQAANNTEVIELPEEQGVDQDPVSRQMETKVVLIEETEAANVCTGGSPGVDMDSGPIYIGDEYGDDAACEQPPLVVNDVDQGLEYEPGSSVTERLECSSTDDVEGVDTRLEYEAGSMVDENSECGAVGEVHKVDKNIDNIQEVQEQAANNTEVIELPKEQGVDQDPVSGQIETNVALVEDTDVPDICTGGSPGVDMDSGPIYIGDESGDDATCEQPPSVVKLFVNDVDQGLEYEPGSSVNEHLDAPHEVDTNIEDVQEMLEQAVSNEAVESLQEQDQELIPRSVKTRSKEEKSAKRSFPKSGSLMKDHRVSYQLPPENEGDFTVFDLVWGKVKSHPWWPGQIFHPSDSSEKAMKYYRKDCYLVAYFGDRTFAWNEASVLKPFRNHFPQAERQNKSEAFQNAVSCALEEVARREEFGLACSCLSEEVYDKIKYQMVENTGIREESSRREGVDRSTGVDSFQPNKLKEYVRTVALFPTSGVDRLELLIAKSQLLAFNRLKGYDALPKFQYHEGLVECDADTPFRDQSTSENEHADSVAGVDAKKGPHKRKHDLKDIVYQRRKEKSMTELMSEYYLDGEFDSHEEDDFSLASPSAAFSGTKRKASGFLTDDSTAQQRIKTISLAKVSHAASSNPQQSFKVGECIRRVASQLTGSSAIIKGCSEGSDTKHSVDDADEVSQSPDDDMTESTPTQSKESTLDEMLSQLHLSARDPMKGYSFLVDIISFFSKFRNLAVTTQRQKMRKGSGRKRKSSVPVVGSPETFEFDDRNDSYWRDMVIQDNAEAKPARRVRKRKDEKLVSGDSEKPLRPNRRNNSRKQYHHDNHESAPEMSTRDEKKLDLPTELMLNFGEMSSVLLEANLNKMFRRFGPLKESETEVDMQSSRARVVFKKRSDAEVAYSSAAMFNIFGSTLVNYQLNYTPASLLNSPLTMTDAKTDAT